MTDAVEAEFRSRAREHPGCFDGMLLNHHGIEYVQEIHGDNPIAAGFTHTRGSEAKPAAADDELQSAWAGVAVAALLVAVFFAAFRVGRLL